MKYALLTEVLGREKAAVLQSLLDTEDIDAVLIQDAGNSCHFVCSR